MIARRYRVACIHFCRQTFTDLDGQTKGLHFAAIVIRCQ